jgi:hypothetical protein
VIGLAPGVQQFVDANAGELLLDHLGCRGSAISGPASAGLGGRTALARGS